MRIFLRVKYFLLGILDAVRVKMVRPFSQEELDDMEDIEKKAFDTSRKKMRTGVANDDDIIELTIRNNAVKLTRASQNPFWRDYERFVFRFISIAVAKYPRQIDLVMNVGLNDVYLENHGIFSFSIPSRSSSNIPLPDRYAMLRYFGRLKKYDMLHFTQKKKQAIFIGSSTGSHDPSHNERLLLCNHFLDNEMVKCYINNICQVDEKDIAINFPEYRKFLHPSLSIDEQLQYRFIISLDGNTTAWDRLVWILNSNSVCLKKKSDHQCWYYDFLEDGKHYVEFDDFDQIEQIMKTITPEECMSITENANAFVQKYLTYEKHLAYTGHLLYFCSEEQIKDIRQTM